VALAPDGSVLIADYANHRIRKISPAGTITTIAGTGTAGYSGDDGPATASRLNYPSGIAVAADGSVLIADRANHRIRKISPAGTITTIAGTGTAGFSGDGGPATAAQLNVPVGVAVTGDGSVLIADKANNRVRKMSPAGTISTLAGTGVAGISGDGGPATAAQLNDPVAVAVTSDGAVLISDYNNQRIRSVSPAGTITTFAGGDAGGFAGDGGAATDAQLNYPVGVAVGPDNTVLIADRSNHRVRSVSATGTITTIAGTGMNGFSGDGAPATDAQLDGPWGLAIAADGTVLIGDSADNRVRELDAIPPQTTITAGPTGTTSDATPTFAFSADQAGSTFECRLDANAFAPCTSPFAVSTLTEGTHTLQVQATDPAGNLDLTPAVRGFTVDTAPDTTITSGPDAATADPTPTFEFSADQTGATFACRIDTAPLAACSSPWTTAALADGGHTFKVAATDPGGNTDPAPATRTFTVDTTAPPSTTPTLTAPAAGDVSATIAVSATSTAAAVQFFVDGNASGSPLPTVAGVASTTWNTWGLTGTHNVAAADCSQAGLCNTAGTSVSVNVSNAAPRLSAPTNGATVSKTVTLTANTDAPQVRFMVDGESAGRPVVPSNGTATTTWTSFGDNNGAHTVTAVNCSTTDACADPAEVTVNLANTPPKLSSPAAGSTMAGAFTMAATAPGGAVEFLLDGTIRGVDTVAPYTLDVRSALPDGSHTAQALSCDATGTECSGPASAVVTFSARTLHPAVSSVSPRTISPNGDGRYDSSTIAVSLPDTETVTWSVRNGAGTTVIGPQSLGSLKAGSHNVTFTGLDNAGHRLPDGAYTVVITTKQATAGTTLHGSATGTVRIDTTAPVLSQVSGNGATFYPVHDGYKDTFSTAVTVSEAAHLTLKVRDSKSKVVRTITAAHSAPGRYTLVWNGRNGAGARVPAGTYSYAVSATDALQNTRSTARYTAKLSAKKLVTKTADVTVTGASAEFSGGTDESCAGPGISSRYTSGLRLINVCDYYYDDIQIADGTWLVTLPKAVKYTGLSLQTYGATTYAPSEIVGFAQNYATDSPDLLTSNTVTDHVGAWYDLGAFSPAGHVSGRTVKVSVDVPNRIDVPPYDFDIKYVRIHVTYSVLK
jgi:flagellar hook assembly protein FlgD